MNRAVTSVLKNYSTVLLEGDKKYEDPYLNMSNDVPKI